MEKKFELSPQDLKRSLDPGIFSFKNTSEIEPLDEVIGQERAVRAIDFGLNMKSPGYNIFVTGAAGTGKSSIVQEIVTRYAKDLPTPDSWCMVNNFKDAYHPTAISLPAGEAARFSKRMGNLIEDLRKRIPREFEADAFQAKQSEIANRATEQKQALFETLGRKAAEMGLKISRTSGGYQTLPILDDKPITPEAFEQLSEEKKAAIEKNVRAIQSEIEETVRAASRLGQTLKNEVAQLVEETARFVVKSQAGVLREDYKECADVLDYLAGVEADIVENVQDFVTAKETSEPAKAPFMQPSSPSYDRYAVNVLVDRLSARGAPVIFETNPTYHHVFGRIEKRAFMGAVTTDFTMVQAGSLLQANGGYLIMEIESVLMNPFVWEALKRTLERKLLFIEDMLGGMEFATASLRPEPIPLDVKVILVGSYEPFQLLQNYDHKFNKIFKVRADFDDEVKRTDNTLQLYARFVARACKEQDLKPFTARAVAGVVEYGEKYVAHQNRLSLRFGPLIGLLKEADYWARKSGAESVSGDHITKALTEYRFRYNLYEEKMQTSTIEKTVMIDTDGEVVGQVNALAVYQVGDFAFGRPSRITAEAFMGKSGVVNIEREAKLSGKTHDKGVLILSGYLGSTFAQNFPLSLSISITFEQNYGGVDGDSASSTELYAILSSLSGLPIKQGLAVTGSVNQKGQIQAIGGVNQKIEGFYDVCQAQGLTGAQGVLIPEANVKNLILKTEVVKAVKKGRFHIYRVSTIEEGIEILTGVPAGTRDEDGEFPEGTVFGKVEKRLKKYLARTFQLKKEFDNGEEEPENG